MLESSAESRRNRVSGGSCRYSSRDSTIKRQRVSSSVASPRLCGEQAQQAALILPIVVYSVQAGRLVDLPRQGQRQWPGRGHS